MSQNTAKSLFVSLPKEEKYILDNFDNIIQNIKPLNSKQLMQLPNLINELSHQLTDERNTRRNGYMNQTVMLSAYVRYFMWWNLYRLTNLFCGFDNDKFSFLKDNDYCLDIGSGPLTLPIALWLSRPELRTKKLVWYCLDISQTALSFGEELFLSIVAKTLPTTSSENATENKAKTESNEKSSDDETENNQDEENPCPWKIIRVKGELGTEIRNKATFITCANMFNELYYDSNKPLEEQAKRYTQTLSSYAANNFATLVIEPAVPRSSRFISLTRDALIRKKLSILSPCLHEKECPMDGRRGGKWCHFVLDTTNAPKKLHKISDAAGLPKDRAALSFVFASNFTKAEPSKEIKFRVASDPIRIPSKGEGRYACSEIGLSLLMNFNNTKSGDEISIDKNKFRNIHSLPIDFKSGAKIIYAN